MSEVLVSPAASDWRVTTLGELCRAGGADIQTGPFGSQLHASDYVASGIPSVMPQNIGDNVIIEDGIARIAPEDAARLSRYLLRDGDIIYSRRGDVERRALVRQAQEGWLCGTGCLRVRLGTSADPRFISYYLGHPDVREWIVRHAIGATMPNLNTGILSNVPVTLPPRLTQLAISGVLGPLDDKIAVNDRICFVHEELLRSHFQELRIDVEDESADELPASELIEFNPRTPTIRSSDAVYLDMSAVPTNSALVRRWSRREPKSGARFMNNDTVMARITPCLENGKVGFVDFMNEGEVGVGSTEFIVMRAKPGVPVHLPYFLARSPRFQDHAIRNMVGSSGRQRVGAVQLADFSITRPDPNSLAAFGTAASIAFSHMKSLDAESKTLAELRDTLLPRLMSGEVRVREAERVVEDAT
ncbi:MAG TPA: restriction endonuclease subunit S [Acidimicrobiales bacterium]|nr:restriction endonuclease subunit S [Acidimicrobiales bacterium]